MTIRKLKKSLKRYKTNMMDKLLNKILSLAKKKSAKQIGLLYTTMMISLVLGVVVSMINTRWLGPKGYGDFKYLTQLFMFVEMFMTLGVFFSGSRLMAQNKYKDLVPRIKGVMLLYAAVASLVMMGGFFIYSFFEDQIYGNNLGLMIRIFSPFVFIFPLKVSLENILTGTNDIYKLSWFRLMPKVIYLGFALAVSWLFDFTLLWALTLEFLGFLVLNVIMVVMIRPDFRNLKEVYQLVRRENKGYGIQVYFSSLANTATMRLAALAIAFFMDNTSVGYFGLAITVTQPLTLIPRVVGTTFFKSFANRRTIPLKATLATVGLSLGALLMFFLFIKMFFLAIYTRDFAPALGMTYYIAFGSIVHGFADYVNRFLTAQGRGKDVRNSAFFVGGVNLVGYWVLIKYFMLTGAVITRVAGSFVYLLNQIYYYKKLQREFSLADREKAAAGKTGVTEATEDPAPDTATSSMLSGGE